MPVLYPTSLDTLDTGHVNDVEELIDALDINDLADVANKLEREVGISANRFAINVKTHFGAVGDGVTDDTAAIQAAINAAAIVPVIGGNARSAIVYFPPGKYVCSGLVMPNNQTFAGSGAGASGTAYGNFITLLGGGSRWGGAWLIRKAATDNVMINASGTITGGGTITRSVGFRIENLTIHGNGGTKPLLRCYYVSNHFFHGVRFDSNLGPAIEGVEFQDSRFYDCWINNCNGATESDNAGTVGKESLRLLGRGDGSPAAGTFGYTTDNCNNLVFVGCLITSNNNPNAGAIAIVTNGAGYPAAHRIFFVNHKIELGSMKGSVVKLKGDASRCQWINFHNADFTGYSLGTAATAITWIDANAAYSCSLTGNILFDDANTAGVTHAPLKLTDAEFWTLAGCITTNLGTVGGEANPAALIDCGFSNGKPLVISGSVRHIGSRTSPWFSGSTITDRRMAPRSGVSTQTPGATPTVNIAHGLGYTPTLINVQPADTDARGAPAFHITADATNIILNFAANLTAAVAYDWRWMAS